MSFFIDTNMAISFTVIHDKWHESSCELFNKDDCLFWSNLVKKEYGVKLNDIIDEIDIFFNLTKDILKHNHKDFINYFDFEKFIIIKTSGCSLDMFKKVKILMHFWNKYFTNDGISRIVYEKFKIFCDEFESVYFHRDEKLNKLMTLHDCGLDNYKKYLSYALSLHSGGIHSPDCKIITDAHDCGLNHDGLIFVSNDLDMISLLNDYGASFLSISEFRSCN